jgi:hypothetical protein
MIFTGPARFEAIQGLRRRKNTAGSVGPIGKLVAVTRSVPGMSTPDQLVAMPLRSELLLTHIVIANRPVPANNGGMNTKPGSKRFELIETDKFLASLGWFSGKPTLNPSPR